MSAQLRLSRLLRLNLAIVIAAAVVMAALIAVIVFFAQGGRWFVIATPSMGTTAPVGTLVLTTPTRASDLHVGDIISFHPPTAKAETYTHRVVNISVGSAISTKGDINGAVDPWMLHGTDLIGKATVLLPGIGWLARGGPILVIGVVLVLVLTRLVRSRQWRAALRILGASLVVSVAAFVLRPFTGVVVLQASARGGSAGATVVSTGLLPIRVSADHGSFVDLLTGQVGHVLVPTYAQDGYYRISSALHLDVGGWIVFCLVCGIPLLGTMIFGLPGTDTFEGGRNA